MEGSSGCVGFNVWLRMGWVYSDKVTAGADTLPPPLHRCSSASNLYQPAGARVPATQAPKQRLEASLYSSSSSSEEGRGERASPAEAPEAEQQEEEERHLVSFSIEWVGEADY